MSTSLRWGDPPQDGTDIGRVDIPFELSNAPGSGVEANASLYESYGMKLPMRARVRTALRIIRKNKYPLPIRCTISGIGALYVGEDGWEVRKV